MIRLLIGIVRYTLIAIFILFMLALHSPTKAVYVLTMTLTYLYVLFASLGGLIIDGANATVELFRNGVM